MTTSSEGMGRRGEVDLLSDQNLHPTNSLTQALKLRKVRMKVEGVNAVQKADVVQQTISVDGHWRAIRRPRWA